ncbi:MAG TPA: pilus assembly protein TadG-related protein [Methyloceanibacter sp.]|nr:pilus assembly protein TadG-related protein [Methyloceanibacter sp.]
MPLVRNLRKFAREGGGNVALLFGFALIPLVLGVGAAIDYGRALIVRERLQDAIDSAGLAAGSWVGLSPAEMQTKAQQYFNANYPPESIGTVGPLDVSSNGNEIHIEATAQVPTTIMRIANFDNLSVKAETTIAVGHGTVEVALVLDNSGSMAGSKIESLRQAATNLVNTLFASAQYSKEPEPLKIAVVPFAASVNVGSQYEDAGWMDTNGEGTYNAYEIKCFANGGTLNGSGNCSVSVGTGTHNFQLFDSLKTSNGDPIAWKGCVEARPYPYDVNDAPANNAQTKFVPLFAPDEPDNWTCSTSGSSACPFAGSSTSTRVYNGAPDGSYQYNNYLPDAGDPDSCPTEFPSLSGVNSGTDILTTSASAAPSSGTPLVFQSTGSLPGGISTNRAYYVINPSGKTFKISTSKNGSALNITSNGSGTIRYAFAANWTCQSGSANCGGTDFGKSEQIGFGGGGVPNAKFCKYGTPNSKAKIANQNVSSYEGGPNFLCTTTPITPLTTNKSTVLSAINAMQAKGMTAIGEGAMWGWRTLSPGEPFAEGRAYNTDNNQKVLILMTDGQNTYQTRSTFLKSWYQIYGYIARGQLGTTSTNSSTITAAMNARTLEACNNIKAAGIVVYTVAFQIPGDEANALTLLQACASDEDKYFAPNTESELLVAFNAIGQDISMLRVAK